ncbi:MAG: hypothetical protein HC941_20645 [Microcoleus sp. SU_5_3]|nr:hypothetical protein [Microcoleus sp. SU_5_3]
MRGDVGLDTVFGDRDNDTVFGGKDDDFVRGGKEDDLLFGDLGDDRLFGDIGADTLTGGGGRDLFAIGKGTGGVSIAGADVIEDFTQSEDFLGLINGLSFGDLNVFQGSGINAGDAIVQDKNTNEFLAVIKGVNSSTISESNFW